MTYQPSSGLSAYDIALICAEAFGIEKDEMFGLSHKRRLSWARHASWHLTREHTTLSYTQIGNRFKRHHTTIIGGVVNSRKQLDKVYDVDDYQAGFSRAERRVVAATIFSKLDGEIVGRNFSAQGTG